MGITNTTTAIVIPRQIVEAYRKLVVPMLKACQLRDNALDDDELVQADLSPDRLEYWPLTLARPIPRRVYGVTPARRATYLFDTIVEWKGAAPEPGGDVRVRVEQVCGERSLCSLTDDPLDVLEHEDWPAAMLVGAHASYLVGLFPGSDTLWAWTCWPHETLPLRYALQRPRTRPSLDRDEGSLLVMTHRRFMLAVECDHCGGDACFTCEECDGSCRLSCPRCDGNGTLTCPPCHGRGSFECRKCGGEGSRTCPKCGGSGQFRGGDCWSCEAAGSQTCNRCDGDGSTQCQTCHGSHIAGCNRCGGEGTLPCTTCGESGSLECRACQGLGLREPSWRFNSSTLTLREFIQTDDDEEWRSRSTVHVPIKAVAIYDRQSDDTMPLPDGGARWLDRIATASTTGSGQPEAAIDAAAVADHQRRIAGFDDLLERVLAAKGERATGPLPFTRPRTAVREAKNEVVYRLALGRSSHFESTTGDAPFPIGSDLVFGEGSHIHRDDAVSLRWQPGAGLPNGRPPYARLRHAGITGGAPYIDVGFPRGIDVASIPEEGFLTADRPRPAERTLQDEVRRWARATNRFNPSLTAIVSPRPPRELVKVANLRNPGIAANEAQLEAVRLGLSEVPLALIKGPPGTGKTTVIVELILQAAERGQKVLICSQTHQAVRNVLERLDERGDVRMYRYGRDEKLSDLERKYARGGSAAADTEGTLDRARKRARIEKDAYEREAADVIAYERAVQGLEHLGQLDSERTRDLAASADRENTDRGAAERQRRASHDAAAAQAKKILDELSCSHEALETERASAAEGIALLGSRARLLGHVVPADEHSEPVDATAPPRVRRQRLRRCLAALAQHEPRHASLSQRHGELLATIATADKRLAESRNSAQSAFKAASLAADHDRSTEVAGADRERQAAVDAATAAQRSSLEALAPPLEARIKKAKIELAAALARQSSLKNAIESLDAKLSRAATEVRRLAGREPRPDAPRSGFLGRWFSSSSLEVIEGEWAHDSALRNTRQTELDAANAAWQSTSDQLAMLERSLASGRSDIEATHKAAVDAATDARQSKIDAEHARHADRMAEAHRDLEAADAAAARQRDDTVGDAPREAAHLAELMEAEKANIAWWTRWRDSLVALGTAADAAAEGLDGQLAGRQMLLADDACVPGETDARVEEIAATVAVLRGIMTSAAADKAANRVRQDATSVEQTKLQEEAARVLAVRLEQITNEREDRDAAIEERIRAEREKCGRRIDAAVRIAAERGISASASDTPAQWQQRIATREPAIRPLRERMEFTTRWVAEVAASPGVVERLHWRHIDVFLATCVGVSAWKEFNNDGPGAADLVIIDEAAHATLPEVLAPMRFGTRTLLIGDEMQLPPLTDVDTRPFQPDGDWLPEDRMDPLLPTALVAMSDDWMERSLFEWVYLRRQRVPRVMLDKQFRMHPHIGEFISQVFYEGKLHNGVTADARHLTFGDFQSAVCVVSTSQYPDRHERQGAGANGRSYLNPTEAEIVVRILEQAAAGLSKPATFGIITPYAAQKNLLRDRVAAIASDLAHVDLDPEADIGSVDSYQGSERDCIIVSLVRSPEDCRQCRGRGQIDRKPCSQCQGRGFRFANLAFARDLRRLNVAFSRARCSLIVVGDFARLCDESIRGGEEGGRILKQFADHVLQKGGAVQHVWEGGTDGP